MKKFLLILLSSLAILSPAASARTIDSVLNINKNNFIVKNEECSVEEQLKKEYKRFSDLGKRFVLDRTFRDLCDESQIDILKEINNIFDKYEDLHKLIKIITKKKNSNFTLYAEKLGEQTLAQTTSYYKNDDFAITFNTLNYTTKEDLKNANTCTKYSVDKNFSAKVDLSKTISYTAAHEMGHILSFLLWVDANRNETFEDFHSNLKKKVLQKSGLGTSDKDTYISDYAQENSREWLAELFIHMMYGKEKTGLDSIYETMINQKLKNAVKKHQKFVNPKILLSELSNSIVSTVA